MAQRRILIAIPHFYKQGDNASYGSGSAQPEIRFAALLRCLAGLHQTFGPKQGVLDIATRTAYPANQALWNTLDIVICTTGQSHLLQRFGHAPALFKHQPTSAEPMRLGYACHTVLREAAGRYDLYGYMEDDLVLHDPLFLDKLDAFRGYAGEGSVLQPNRFEVALGRPFDKLYIDGDLRRGLVEQFVNFADGAPEAVDMPVFGRTMRFARTLNPHSGCFFLTNQQLGAWANCPEVMRGDTSFVGPLESAATLGLMRAFAVYKPHAANAGLLEIEHCGTRFLSLVGQSIPVVGAPPA
jgi:hypothetical protein